MISHVMRVKRGSFCSSGSSSGGVGVVVHEVYSVLYFGVLAAPFSWRCEKNLFGEEGKRVGLREMAEHGQGPLPLIGEDPMMSS